MARCCAVVNGDGITGTLIFHQVLEHKTSITSDQELKLLIFVGPRGGTN